MHIVHGGRAFSQGKSSAVSRQFRELGRQKPDGLRYVDSWITASRDVCFQLMECNDATQLPNQLVRWEGRMGCEIIPVTSSKETGALMERLATSKTVTII